MTTALTTNKDAEWTRDQVELIKRMFCKGGTDDELKVFLYTAKRTGLDPLARQIYAIKRGGQMTIQAGIDGFRLIADRTGKYAPGDVEVHMKDGKPEWAKATVKKLVEGEWHHITATAYYEEYVQMYNGKPGGLWAKMPRVMLSKCAESAALRRAFPAELSGVYTTEEMTQSDAPQDITPRKKSETKTEVVDAQVDTDGTTAIGKVDEVKVMKTGKNKSGEWKLYGVKLKSGEVFGTFEFSHSELAEYAQETDKAIRIEFKSEQNGKYVNRTITNLEIYNDNNGGEETEEVNEDDYQEVGEIEFGG